MVNAPLDGLLQERPVNGVPVLLDLDVTQRHDDLLSEREGFLSNPLDIR
jgi:hypothetical protein